MKKILIASMVAGLSLTATAQESQQFTKGNVETVDFGSFRLHVYNSNDVMADASYVIEGQNALVTMEQPLFKDNVEEFNVFLNGLGKPVAKRIADYHIGGTFDLDIVMPEGMSVFVKHGPYAAMMQGFAKSFGDAIVALPTGKVEEVAFSQTKIWAGVEFTFLHGASTDFPAASINIGGKIYFTHWAPAKAHMNALQISSAAVIDAELAETNKALASGCSVFIGGHGGKADRSAAEFKANYLAKMKEIYSKSTTAEAFVDAMKAAFPNLSGEDGLTAVAQNLYK